MAAADADARAPFASSTRLAHDVGIAGMVAAGHIDGGSQASIMAASWPIFPGGPKLFAEIRS